MRRLLIVPLVALVVIGIQFGLNYRGTYSPPALPRPEVERILLPSYPSSEEALEALAQRAGVVLVDTGHSNTYSPEEVDPLLSRITARGHRIEFLAGRDPREAEGVNSSPQILEEKLRFADSFVVLLPAEPYSPQEVELVKRFVEKGGRVFLVGDPTRQHVVDSLANAFGIIFRNDYLYNVKEHESNFRNVFFTQFTPDLLTLGLQRVTFYTASSITGTGEPLAIAGEGTASSVLERRETLTPMVKDTSGLVLAIGDFTFIGEPHNSITDNHRLLSNIADFLTTSRRTFELADFPHFLKQGADIVVGNAVLLPHATLLKELLVPEEGTITFREREDFQRDTVFMGLFQEADRVRHYLSRANIRLDADKDGHIITSFTPPLRKEGTGLIYLDTQAGRRALVLLAENKSAMDRLVELLQTGEFRSGLVSDALGLYPGVPTTTEEPS